LAFKMKDTSQEME
jgi:hypothetical protein